jgi:hypothetical protein
MFGAEGIDFMLGGFDDDRMNGDDGPDILNSLSFWYVYTCMEVITAKKVVFSR